LTEEQKQNYVLLMFWERRYSCWRYLSRKRRRWHPSCCLWEWSRSGRNWLPSF